MALRDTAIVGYAEAKHELRSGRDVWDYAAEILDSLLERTGLEREEIDGMVLCPSATGTSSFWQQSTMEYLGLETDFSDTTDLGGCSAAGGVARAAAAIEAGFCETVVLINADAPTTEYHTRLRNAQSEWGDPVGLAGPKTSFGLLSRRYEHLYGLDLQALGKLAVTQRQHAVLNPNAVERLRHPITVEDYIQSRMIADPIRLLDCVMPCDGANGLVMMSGKRARQKGYAKFVRPIGYGERTNYGADRNDMETTETGHKIAAERAFAAAGITAKEVGSFHPYDDFIIAIMLTMEMVGFCKPGQGAAFIHEHDFSFSGDLPLNTSGGQISAGQAGLSGGGTNLIEAVRQLFGEAGARQVGNISNALVTGIGAIPYGRNWGSSVALVLQPDA